VPFCDYAILAKLYFTLRIDDEGRAQNSHLASTINFFLLPDPVFVTHFAVFISDQFYAQAVFVAKAAVGDTVIPADADDYRIELAKLFFEVAELDGFNRTALRFCRAIWKV
jgi:hypothetical protein